MVLTSRLGVLPEMKESLGIQKNLACVGEIEQTKAKFSNFSPIYKGSQEGKKPVTFIVL